LTVEFSDDEEAALQCDGLPKDGLVRLWDILRPTGPIPMSKSTWWAGVEDGRYPKPVKLGPRITAWRVEDIRRLIEAGGG